MRILITYHNFVRDFRGSWLLGSVLRTIGHKVYVLPHWNDDVGFAQSIRPDIIVAPQISEHSTAYIASYCSENKIHLVLNSSEQFTGNNRANVFLKYDCSKWNSEVISLQNIACTPVWNEAMSNPAITNKAAYQYLGLPRFDLALSADLREAETNSLILKYNLNAPAVRRKLLYLSSFLFADTFIGVPLDDMKTYGYNELIKKNEENWQKTLAILKNYLKSMSNSDDLLLVKKHPWDNSERLEEDLRGLPVVFIDQSEYIVPCIDMADVVLHSFSTSAIEAWAMNKHTVSIGSSNDYDSYDLPHLSVELFAGSAADLNEALRTDCSECRQSFLSSYLGNWLDGRSTVRMAEAINELKPKTRDHKLKFGRSLIKGRIKAKLYNEGLITPPRQNSSKIEFLRRCELDRRRLIKLYSNPIQRYIANAKA